ncbi:MAG: hypothetical protein JWM05_2508, partial [Acidimicrobiales bacterium]|nr:hypothetical protein [Acidimicrobiales bacterium]
PSTTLAGQVLAPAVTVSTVDAGGQPAPAAGPVVVSIASGPAGATLLGVTSRLAPTGTVTFAGLRVERVGTYVLRIAGAGLPPVTTPSFTVINQRLAVPAYFYPGPHWTGTIAATPSVDLAVMNPASGPGAAVDPAYTAQLAAAHQRGLAVVGYVYADYGARSLATVKADIARFYALYRIDGIFIDLTESSCTRVASYYVPLYQYAKSFGASAGHTSTVVINPGVQVPECFTTASDVIVNFEGFYADYVASYSAPAWVARYSPRRFWHIVHDATQVSQAVEAVRLGQLRRAGRMFVTDEAQTPPPPDVYTYDRLPKAAIWSAEIRGVNRRPSAPPTAVTAVPGMGQATVHWSAPATNAGAALTGYVVTPYMGSTALAGRAFAGTATTRAITGLSAGTTYAFRVTATNPNGSGPPSSASPPVTVL